MSISERLAEINESIRQEESEYVEAGVIDEDQITEWRAATPQDISWLPEE